jgi:hypothetical protein
MNTLYYPSDITMDNKGNLWVSEYGNNRILKYNGMQVTSTNISRWSNSAPVTVTINGQDIDANTSIKLIKGGSDPIAATGINVISSTTISAMFNVAGAAPGYWDMVFNNADLQAALPNALLVDDARIVSVDKTYVLNIGTVALSIQGENFSPGTVVTLSRADGTAITAHTVTLSSSTQLLCDFDINGIAAGSWNITIPPGNRQLS